MANNIELAKKYGPGLDKIYKLASKTARMDGAVSPVSFTNAATVEFLKIAVVGLGNYDRNVGYPKGDVTATWEAWTLSQSRGREFSVDRMDNEETLNQTFGAVVGEFVRTQVVPEVDAYRFAKYAGTPGIGKAAAATLSKTTIVDAIDAAKGAMDAAEVPEEGRLLFISDTCKAFLEGAVSRTLANESTVDKRVQTYNGMEVIMVPQRRFYTAITLDPGATTTAGGFAKTASTGADINFLLIHPSAVAQVTKLALPKSFDPDVNQSLDAWKFQYRLYHDAFVYDNKKDGIYLHAKAAG
ncbi:MAG: hypothetical protein VB108_01175 [Anaerolineaceae bacterium]|nr:hypothetical protein [Anaerolineaceae bacterium]